MYKPGQKVKTTRDLVVENIYPGNILKKGSEVIIVDRNEDMYRVKDLKGILLDTYIHEEYLIEI